MTLYHLTLPTYIFGHTVAKIYYIILEILAIWASVQLTLLFLKPLDLHDTGMALAAVVKRLKHLSASSVRTTFLKCELFIPLFSPYSNACKMHLISFFSHL